MFANLYVEMKKAKVTQVKMAAMLGVSNRTLNKKILNGVFTSDEMFAIQREFFPNKTLEYLFTKD